VSRVCVCVGGVSCGLGVRGVSWQVTRTLRKAFAVERSASASGAGLCWSLWGRCQHICSCRDWSVQTAPAWAAHPEPLTRACCCIAIK
jgi:hypothetical protein